MAQEKLGFVGLGTMGGPMAANVAKAGVPLIAYDIAGTAERAPKGATVAGSVSEVAAGAELMILSLPDGRAANSVADEIIASNSRKVRVVADTSTIGAAAAQALHGKLAKAGVSYVDAPVSGMPSGARDGTLSVMYAGPAELLERLRPAFEALGKNVFHLGEKPGQGQAMKALNNYMAFVALFGTSEAVSYGLREGLDHAQMIEVMNVSSGRNIATMAMFPNWVIAGGDMGFPAKGLLKDMTCFLEGARAKGSPLPFGGAMEAVAKRFAAARPNADMMRAFEFIRDGK
jgi:3-hydroxyisobutyrate dehydrogenase-like beta-hydroxyacid dehydrogenase